MYELPLFPLNTVLFPGTPIQLHIFEERYQQMVAYCLEEKQPFGVVMIRHGREALGPLAETFPIGCTAQIFQVESLEQGRMNITALGRERFRILTSMRSLKPYLVGKVENYPLVHPEDTAVRPSARVLEEWVRRYLGILLESGRLEINLEQLPGDPLLLAYTAAALLQVPSLEKQELLSVPDAAGLIASLRGLYRREVALLRAFVADEPGQDGAFSLN